VTARGRRCDRRPRADVGGQLDGRGPADGEVGIEDGGREGVEGAQQRHGVDRLAVGKAKPAPDAGHSAACAPGERSVVRVEVKVDAPVERRGERGGRREVDAVVDRWQVFTIGGGQIVEIVGFDDRADAVMRASG